MLEKNLKKDMESEMKINSMITPIEFLKSVNAFAEKTGLNHLEAVVEYCELNNIEIEVAAAIIKKSGNSVKEKIQIEGERLNILEKSDTNKLPL